MYLYASPGRTNQEQHPNTKWGEAQSRQPEVVMGSIKIQQYTEVTYLEAGRKHNIEQTLIWQQSKFCWGSRGIHILWCFFDESFLNLLKIVTHPTW